MKKVSITEARNHLRALIASGKGGASVLIVDRGHPVARLEPVRRAESGDGKRLARLIRDGVVRPARSLVSKDLFTTNPPSPRSGASGVRALLNQRRTGR